MWFELGIAVKDRASCVSVGLRRGDFIFAVTGLSVDEEVPVVLWSVFPVFPLLCTVCMVIGAMGFIAAIPVWLLTPSSVSCNLKPTYVHTHMGSPVNLFV
jgi:hypothetical protein